MTDSTRTEITGGSRAARPVPLASCAFALALLLGSNAGAQTARAGGTAPDEPSPVVAHRAEPARAATAPPAAAARAPATPGAAATDGHYASRDARARAKGLETFKGGDTVVIVGGSALVIVLVVLVILIVL